MQMTYHISVLFALIFIHHTSSIHYFEFSSQSESYEQFGQNYAILSSGARGQFQNDGFTICGSIFVGYFRGRQAFYTLKQSGSDALLLSLFFETGRDLNSGYTLIVSFGGGTVFNSGKVDLKPHAWSHACTSVSASGHVMVAVNGVITHDVGTPLELSHLTDFVDNF